MRMRLAGAAAGLRPANPPKKGTSGTAVLFLHGFFWQMPPRIFGRAPPTLDGLFMHPLARREVLRIARPLCALAGSPFRLSGAWRGRLCSTLSHGDGRDAKQCNG